MTHPYVNYSSNVLQPAEHQHSMAPPPPPTSDLYSEPHYFGRYPESAPASSSHMHIGSNLRSWHPAGVSLLPPPFQPAGGLDLAPPSREVHQPMHPHPNVQPPNTQVPRVLGSSGRTAAVSSADWLRVKNIVQKLWLDEKQPLEVTRTILSEHYGFKASSDQYKKQIKKWKWGKYLRDEDAIWMLRKADARRKDEKDTEFKYRGQILSQDDIIGRLARKKIDLESTALSPSATTPCDVTYATPREVVLSPAGGVPNPSGNAQSAWSRPPSTKSAQHIRLVWNGFKRTDFQQQYRDGLQDEQSGRTDDAEVKFRTALEGFHHLLSTTHHETLEAAHRLAAFYAQYSRMREAELILDWLIEAHVEDYGPSHEKTINQLLSVVQFYQDWHQPDEAAALLERLHLDREKRQHCKEDHDRTVEQTDRQVATPEEIPPNTDEAPALSITSTVVESVVESDVSIPSDRAIDPASINAYLRNVQNTPESDDHAVEIMNELLKHCNEFSKQLLCHSLLIHAALIAHHDRFMDVSRRDEATDEAEKAVNYLLHSDQPKTEVLFNVCLRLTEQFVKVGKYDTANDIFGHIEADAQQTFGFAHLRTIAMLKRIGKFYQDEGRWQDAAPRFEHALAASLSRYNPRDRSVKRLEAALEAQHYETDSSSKYDDVDYDSDSPGRKGRGRDVLRLDFRGTRPWIDR